jgi:hypothetical protein
MDERGTYKNNCLHAMDECGTHKNKSFSNKYVPDTKQKAPQPQGFFALSITVYLTSVTLPL